MMGIGEQVWLGVGSVSRALLEEPGGVSWEECWEGERDEEEEESRPPSTW